VLIQSLFKKLEWFSHTMGYLRKLSSLSLGELLGIGVERLAQVLLLDRGVIYRVHD
jgi:hypothetical protein